MNNKRKEKCKPSAKESTPAETRLGEEKRYEGESVKTVEDLEPTRDKNKRSSYHD